MQTPTPTAAAAFDRPLPAPTATNRGRRGEQMEEISGDFMGIATAGVSSA